eukprot:CAMPEP_0198731280 /NCGR_PEP_ID=MMETSP1475-20131203/29170_1 /TAXON_ID= ORGANISM="Unidentified sp., Strain CCMP1999" /NCGR_SAMPLE_ID=MMETSP1475 /ASSEMBLY_ACC=CAM_ASM_001111 /LENGTH=45 /DNA_ID= /DNA_START= /DNA_END= /DNA_ORIENTATION=
MAEGPAASVTSVRQVVVSVARGDLTPASDMIKLHPLASDAVTSPH